MTAAFGGLSHSGATVALSLTAAVVWGTSDFLGGMAARRWRASAVVALSHTLSLMLLVGLALAMHSPAPDGHSAVYGLLGGVACGSGVMLLYSALAMGGMGITAAISGVIAALLPVLWAFSTEGLPTLRQLAGILLAGAAIWLIARTPDANSTARAVWMGAAAGACFGALFIFLKLAGRGGVLWPLACSRVASSSVALGVWLTSRRRTAGGAGATWRLDRIAIALVATAGLFDAFGNSSYTLATRLGRLDIAAVLSSLYPASTILLAAVVLRERTTRSQALGMALALVAVVLISA